MKMINSIFMLQGYISLGKYFGSKIFIRPLTMQYVSCNRRMYSSIKQSQCFKQRNLRVLHKNILCSKTEENGKMPRSTVGSRYSLMNFPVSVSINPFKILNSHVSLTEKLRQTGEDLQFIENTKFPLEQVMRLLSESRFSELEGLLTDECRDEVEKNVKAMWPAKRADLAIQTSDIVVVYPIDVEIIKDGDNDNKRFLQISCAYHVLNCFGEALEGKRSFFEFLMELNMNKLSVFNCRFIKECTEGVDDQWKINAINLVKF